MQNFALFSDTFTQLLFTDFGVNLRCESCLVYLINPTNQFTTYFIALFLNIEKQSIIYLYKYFHYKHDMIIVCYNAYN